MDKFLSSFCTLAKIGVSESLKGSLAGGLREVLPREPSVPQSEGSISDSDDKYLSLGYLEHNPPSLLIKEKVEGWKERFSFPWGFEIQVPYSDEKADFPLDGWFAVYEIFLRLGLRFLILAFASSVLENYHIMMWQLMPNSWRVIVRLVDLAEKSDVYLHDKDFLSLFYEAKSLFWWHVHLKEGLRDQVSKN